MSNCKNCKCLVEAWINGIYWEYCWLTSEPINNGTPHCTGETEYVGTVDAPGDSYTGVVFPNKPKE